MKKLLLAIIISSIFSINAYCSHKEKDSKLYVKIENVEEINDVFIIKPLLPIGIIQPVRYDGKGYFIYEHDLVNMMKGRLSYHYCRHCDQEFFTDSAYQGHVCRRNYYDHGGHSLFSRNPE
jgi:hypothetical protein